MRDASISESRVGEARALAASNKRELTMALIITRILRRLLRNEPCTALM